MITLALRTVNRDNVWEIETVLNWRSADIGGICTKVLNLLLLNLLNTFTAEILKISEAPIVLDVADYSGKILLLLLVLWRSNSLIHHVNIIMWLSTCRYVLKVIKLKHSIGAASSSFSDDQRLIITVSDLRASHHMMWGLLDKASTKLICTVFVSTWCLIFIDVSTISSWKWAIGYHWVLNETPLRTHILLSIVRFKLKKILPIDEHCRSFRRQAEPSCSWGPAWVGPSWGPRCCWTCWSGLLAGGSLERDHHHFVHIQPLRHLVPPRNLAHQTVHY